MTKYLNAKNGLEITNLDVITQILVGDEDPSIIGLEADLGSIFLRHDYPFGIYQKKDTSDTSWEIVTSSGGDTTASGTYNFSFEEIREPISIPEFQQMIVMGCMIVEEEIIIEGSLILEI